VGTEKRERQKANRAQRQQQMQQEANRRKTFRLIAIGVGAVAAVFLIAWIASNFVSDDDPAQVPADSIVPATLVEGSVPVDTTPSSTPSTTPSTGTQG
jgi:ferric-dicitrate binding protein FerR (iron transport regulator)